jgi:hypothetical protein
MFIVHIVGFLHANTRRFLESSGEEAIVATATVHARRIFVVYLLITLVGSRS